METLRHLTADLGTVDDDPGSWIFVLEVSGHVLVKSRPRWPHWNFAKFQKHKINPRNGYSTDRCLQNTIHMAQMFLFEPLPQSTKS